MGVIRWMDRQIESHRILTIIVVAVLVAGPGYLRVEELIHDIETSRTIARQVTCDEQNVTYTKINALIAQAGPKAEPFIIELRDCSPEGISAYYDGKK